MAMSNRKQSFGASDHPQAIEQNRSAHVVAMTADSIASPVPSPALALQQIVAARAANGFIADPSARRRALIRFVGTAILLWGGAASGLAALIHFAG